jgi:hypothetical protein
MYLMKGMAALAFGLVAVSCNKSDIFNPYADQEKNQQEFTEIQAAYPNKMVVLGECGWDGSDKTGRPQGDIAECWNQGAKWGLFMVWYDRNAGNKTNTMVSDAWWQSALNKENAAIVVGN